MKVFKYKIPETARFELALPKGAKVLSFDSQYDDPCLWALVDPEAKLEDRSFIMTGTGHDVDPTGYRFVGTTLLLDGSLVLHLWEKPVGPIGL